MKYQFLLIGSRIGNVYWRNFVKFHNLHTNDEYRAALKDYGAAYGWNGYYHFVSFESEADQTLFALKFSK